MYTCSQTHSALHASPTRHPPPPQNGGCGGGGGQVAETLRLMHEANTKYAPFGETSPESGQARRMTDMSLPRLDNGHGDIDSSWFPKTMYGQLTQRLNPFVWSQFVFAYQTTIEQRWYSDFAEKENALGKTVETLRANYPSVHEVRMIMGTDSPQMVVKYESTLPFRVTLDVVLRCKADGFWIGKESPIKVDDQKLLDFVAPAVHKYVEVLNDTYTRFLGSIRDPRYKAKMTTFPLASGITLTAHRDPKTNALRHFSIPGSNTRIALSDAARVAHDMVVAKHGSFKGAFI